MSTITIPAYALPPLTLNSVLYPSSAVEQLVMASRDRSSVDVMEYAREAIKIHCSPSEIQRQQRASLRRAVLNDSWREWLAKDMRNRLQPEVFKAVCGESGQYVDITRNPARDIWRELAVLYKSAAIRKTEGSDDAEKYAALCAGSKLNSFWSTVEIWVEAFNDVLIWPTVISGKVRHNCAAGDTVTLLIDDAQPGADPFGVLISDVWRDLEGCGHVRYHFYTAEWYVLVNESGRRLDPSTGIEIPDDAEGWRNTLGELPFVRVRRDPYHPQPWDTTTGDDLVTLTLKTGRQQTYGEYLRRVAGHKQLIYSSDRLPAEAVQLLDPASMIRLPGGTSFQLIDWQVDLSAQQEIVDRDEIRAAASRGINPERMRRASYQSADAARLAERGLTERREAKEEIFLDAEAEYYRKVCLVARQGLLRDVPDPSARLEVTHAPIDYPGDPSARLDLAAKRASLGVGSLLEVVLEDHPTWNRDQALEYIADTIELTATIAEIKASRNVPNDLTNESRSAEINGAMGTIARDKGNAGTAHPESMGETGGSIDGIGSGAE